MATCRVHNVRFYDLQPRAVHCMSYESDLKKLALSRSDASLEIWDFSHSPHIERTLPASANSSVEAVSWCGKRLFSAGLQGTITEYNLQTLSSKYEVPVTAGPCWCLEINRTKSHLAAGTEDGYINIFSVTDDGLLYEKVLDRQEGRILCLAWDATGDTIVTGSTDAVRIWNVESGHVVQRMTPGRAQASKETIVWCVTVTADFTVISGDSRGRLSFWDGNTGTLIEGFQSHKADILSVCLGEEDNSVYCAGVDAMIVSFTKVWLPDINGAGQFNGGGQDKWVRSVRRRIHEHDVRALTLIQGKLLSAGVDGYLAVSSYPPRLLVKYPPLLQDPCVCICPEVRCVMLRYPSHLEVWRAGTSAPIDDAAVNYEGEELPLHQNPVRLLTLKSRGGDEIVCASMSNNGEWIAYSTLTNLRLFKFEMDAEDGKPVLHKVPIMFEMAPAHRIVFNSESTRLIVATSTGDIAVILLSGDEPALEHVFHPMEDKILKDAVHILTISQDGEFIVAGDHKSNIGVWSTSDWKLHCSLPRYKCPVTAFAVQPQTNNLVVVYSDYKLVEYSLSARKYTDFSRGLEKHTPAQWVSTNFSVNNILLDPKNDSIIIIQDDTVCVINRDKDPRVREAKTPKIDSSKSGSESMDSPHIDPTISDPTFHVIKRYKHLVHMGWLSDDELIAVEVRPTALTENLPPALEVKKYGVM